MVTEVVSNNGSIDHAALAVWLLLFFLLVRL
jgi:hypothetical protein